MRIGILGTGMVRQTIGTKLVQFGARGKDGLAHSGQPQCPPVDTGKRPRAYPPS